MKYLIEGHTDLDAFCYLANGFTYSFGLNYKFATSNIQGDNMFLTIYFNNNESLLTPNEIESIKKLREEGYNQAANKLYDIDDNWDPDEHCMEFPLSVVFSLLFHFTTKAQFLDFTKEMVQAL